MKWKSLSPVRLFVTPWTVAPKAPPSMEFSRQEYWSGLSCPSPRDLLDPQIEPGSLALQEDFLPFEPPGRPVYRLCVNIMPFYIRDCQAWYLWGFLDLILHRCQGRITNSVKENGQTWLFARIAGVNGGNEKSVCLLPLHVEAFRVCGTCFLSFFGQASWLVEF